MNRGGNPGRVAYVGADYTPTQLVLNLIAVDLRLAPARPVTNKSALFRAEVRFGEVTWPCCRHIDQVAPNRIRNGKSASRKFRMATNLFAGNAVGVNPGTRHHEIVS